MADDIKDEVRELVERPLLQEGAELVDVVVSRYKGRATLRLFVYSQNGTTVGECARLSRIVSDIIDGAGLFESGYTLEVSSPGLDRPLRTARDFRFRIGETVEVGFIDRTKKNVTGRIVAATSDDVELENESGVFTLELSEIEQAKIAF